MEIKRGYKQTEIGVIPIDWDVKQLGDLFEISSSKRVFQSEWKTAGIPFYRARELAVLGDQGYVNNELFISKEMYSAYKNTYGIPQIGDMLVTGVGTLGKVYVISDNSEFYFKDGNIIWFKISGKVVPDFLRQLYSTLPIIKQIEDGSAGTTVGTYTISGAKKTTIPFPPLAEQRAIAAALSDVDVLLAALDALIAKKRFIKQGAMQELLTGKKRLPGFSGEWGTVKFEELADKNIKWSITGGPFGSNLKASEYISEGVRIIQLQNIGDGVFYDDYAIYTSEQKANELISCNIFPGEIILSKMGDPVARACIVPTTDHRYLMASDGIRLSVDKKRFDKRFVFYYINSIYFRRKAVEASTGTTRQRIGLTTLKNLPFVGPSLPEQLAIGEILTDMDVEIAALEQRQEKTRLLKQGMMQELLTGRIRLV